MKEDLNKSMWLEYPMKITDIAEVNESFAACMIRVMYTGKNRNKTSISKDAVEKAIPTLFNCPIVCNYNVEQDTIGGHDVEVVKTEDGIKLINLTDAIGVIPAGTEYHWEKVEENGVTHEYLCIGGLLWKRAPAYEKIKRDGVEGQSMEVSVKNGKSVDGFYEIYDFSFTALCILGEGVEPCFESASIETFSLEVCKRSFALMMEDLKKEYSVVIPASADDIYTNSLKGGESKVNLDELMAKYGLSAEEIDFETAEMSSEELESKLSEIAESKKFQAEDTNDSEQASDNEAQQAGGNEDTQNEQTFSLTAEQFLNELFAELRKETVYDAMWECNMPRYWYVDCDMTLSEVYAEDREDHNLYGMKYSMNGDHVVIDFASAKRKKVAFLDFDDGEMPESPAIFCNADEAMKERMGEITKELNDLRAFKANEIEKQFSAAKEELFSRFADLAGNQMFEALREGSGDMSIEQIEDKCYAIRGRAVPVKFSLDEGAKSVRMPIEKVDEKPKDEPYGGVFYKYGMGR